MNRILVRLLRTVLWLAFSVALVSALASVAVTTGVLDVAPGDDPSIETPDPLPDWPFVWELPIDVDLAVETEPRPEPADEADVGDRVTQDPGRTSADYGGTTVTSSEIEALIHDQVNAIREEEGLSRLSDDDEVASVARTHSHDMAARDYFDHVSPEGTTPADRFGDLYPAECVAAGENIAFVRGGGTVDEDELASMIVDGWMNSEGHRENILSDRWDAQGIGVYVESDSVHATQNFCGRR